MGWGGMGSICNPNKLRVSYAELLGTKRKAFNEMNLVIFHIGPVQDFIATARRSRDLWFGSWLLSELSKAAALEIVNQNEADIACLVFPAPSNLTQLQSEDFNVPNKVVALVQQPPADLGKAVRAAILKRLHEVRDEAYRKVSGKFARAAAERQVGDMLALWGRVLYFDVAIARGGSPIRRQWSGFTFVVGDLIRVCSPWFRNQQISPSF